MHFLSCTHMMPACYNSHLLCTVHCVFPWLRTLSSSTCVRAMEKACIWPRGDFPFISFLSLQTTWTSWDQDICSLKNRGNSFDKRVWFYVVFIASTPRIQMTKANKQLYNNKDHLGRGCRTKCSQNPGIDWLESRVILILIKLIILNFACCQVVAFCSLILFLFLLWDLSFPCRYYSTTTMGMGILLGKWQKFIFWQ